MFCLCFVLFFVFCFLILPCIDALTLINFCTELMLWKIRAVYCTMKLRHGVKCICFWSQLCKHYITSQVKNVLLCFKLLKLLLERRNYKLVCQLCFALSIHWRHVFFLLPVFMYFIINFLSLNHPQPTLNTDQLSDIADITPETAEGDIFLIRSQFPPCSCFDN